MFAGTDKAGWRKGLHRLGRMAADFVVPPQCLACREPIVDAGSLCPACWKKLQFIEEPCCARLGTPFAYDEGEGAVSAAALADPPLWNRARAAVAFNEQARQLIHALKYQDRHEAGLLMARLMLRAGCRLFAGTSAVIPIPLHWFRLWSRRYNQSALLARPVADAAGLAFRPELLIRRKPTRQQVGLDHEARRMNVRKAFAVPERFRGEVAGGNFILIDDVLTTGATAGACAEALTMAGAARVDVLAFALVVEPKRIHI